MSKPTVRRSRMKLLIAALVSIATFALNVGASGAALTATTAGNDNADPTGQVITVTLSGPFDGAAIIALTSCGNAKTDGTPLTQTDLDALADEADICWGATETSGLTLPEAEKAAAVIAPVDGTDYVFNYNWINDGIGIEDSTCVADGNFDCRLIATALDGTLMPVGERTEIPVVDPDQDGIGSIEDNCPDDSNADQTNTDGLDDGGDACDDDDDEDGVLDDVDNCRVDANPDQEDKDEDGIGAACDTDDTQAGRMCAADATHPFTDVPDSSFAKDDVACIFDLKVTTGTSATTYSPGDDVTREQMAAFLARMYKAMTGDDAPIAAHPFTDVPSSSFASDAVGQIYGLEITTGTSATTYSPSDPVTREQMAAFIARLFKAANGADAPVEKTPFTDVDATSFGADAIGQIYGLEITTGTSATTYDPDGNVTREQMASFLARLYVAQ